MVEVLLVLFIFVIIWLFWCQEREWFIVEWRTCSDKRLCPIAFNPQWSGFDRHTAGLNDLTLEPPSVSASVLKHKDGAEIVINQTVFTDFDAARAYFHQMQQDTLLRVQKFHKLFLWRIIATSRRKALTLPPKRYADKDGRVLLAYPEGTAVIEVQGLTSSN